MGQLRSSALDTIKYDKRLAQDRLMEMGIESKVVRSILREMEANHKREQLLADLRAGRKVKIGSSL